jgi:hypothetical protein
MAYAGPKSNTPPSIGYLAHAARMLSTKGNGSSTNGFINTQQKLDGFIR